VDNSVIGEYICLQNLSVIHFKAIVGVIDPDNATFKRLGGI
jgi:hypothetical protein